MKTTTLLIVALSLLAGCTTGRTHESRIQTPANTAEAPRRTAQRANARLMDQRDVARPPREVEFSFHETRTAGVRPAEETGMRLLPGETHKPRHLMVR
jgi:hypothetical protein